MILRRVIDHVRTQNWTAVALDFVIVVVGVFIGLQVQEWSAARADHRSEVETLAAIADDLQRELLELETGEQMALLSVRAAGAALAAAGETPKQKLVMPLSDIPQLNQSVLDLATLDLPSLPEGASLWPVITVRYFPTRSSVAFDALASTGNLELIRDDALVRRLQQYQQLWFGLEQSQLSTFREYRNRAIFEGQALGLGPFSEISEAELGALLRERPSLRGAVKTTRQYSLLHYSQLRSLAVEANALIARIEADLSE